MIGQVRWNLHLGHGFVCIAYFQHRAIGLCPAIKQGVTIGITGVDLQVQSFTGTHGFRQCAGVLNHRCSVGWALGGGDIEQFEAQARLVVNCNGPQGVSLRFRRIGQLHIQVAACFFVLNIQGFIAPLVSLNGAIGIGGITGAGH